MTEDRLGEVRSVGAVDAHEARRAGLIWAAAVRLDFPDLELRESALACQPADFPYVPGLLSFREAPAMLDALGRLSALPDLLLVDGQGLAHPRRFGLACHLGVLADLPTVGVAKSRLTGVFEEPGTERGRWTTLRDGAETLGAVLRSRRATRPLFVSVGHRLGLATAIAYVLRCTPRYRLPEPLRLADRLSRVHPP